MYKNKPILILLAVFLVTGLACRLTEGENDSLFPTTTPDLTGTAFFGALLTPTRTAQLANTATATIEPTATQTEISLATATDAPVPTYIARNGVLVLARWMPIPPVIDGSVGEWDLTHYAISAVVYGANLWSGSADLSAEVMVGWDENNLYLAGLVVDDMYVQNGSEETIFRGDSFEILLDTKLGTDLLVAELSPDDFQLGIAPGSPTVGVSPETYLWFPVSVAGPRNRVTVGAVKTDTGYHLEASIPWSVFEVTPQAALEMGFAVSISDNDLVGQSVQQTMISLAGSRRLADPTTWGKIVLER